ncbi:MAG: hypothetical protein PHD67_05640 [Oscillospiraceae bacterium]|nr:hypothetical protein [Oscillospiraceae bacterium]
MIIELKIPKKTRYLITIDRDETPAYVSRELQPGIITIMITARTPEEAELLRKEQNAVLRSAAR